MVNITLVCSGGLSTSLMVNKMINAAEAEELECNIIAISADNFSNYVDKTDVLLIAPQLSYRYDEIVKEFGEKLKVVEVIEMIDYGLMNGQKVLKMVMSKLD